MLLTHLNRRKEGSKFRGKEGAKLVKGSKALNTDCQGKQKSLKGKGFSKQFVTNQLSHPLPNMSTEKVC